MVPPGGPADDRPDRPDEPRRLSVTAIDATLAQYADAIQTVEDTDEDLRRRRHRSLPERLRLGKALRDAKHEPHPATRWLEEARRYPRRNWRARPSSPPASPTTTPPNCRRSSRSGGGSRPSRARRAVDGRREAAWERIIGTAAGSPDLFERKRREAQANAKLGELKDARKVATLPRQPLLAEPGAIQIPRFAFRWLVGDEARDGAWTVMDLGVLVAVLGRVRERRPVRVR